MRTTGNLGIKNLLFIPAHIEACHCCDPEPNDQIKDEDGEVENTAVGEAALFKEHEWKPGTGDVVGAGSKPKEGWQATVREKMRGKQVEEDKCGESDQESFEEGLSRRHVESILFLSF